MAEFARPAGYLDKLLFAQRAIKTVPFPHDQKKRILELGEAMTELLLAVIARYFVSSGRRHTSCLSDWSSVVCSSDLCAAPSRSNGTSRNSSSTETAKW